MYLQCFVKNSTVSRKLYHSSDSFCNSSSQSSATALATPASAQAWIHIKQFRGFQSNWCTCILYASAPHNTSGILKLICCQECDESSTTSSILQWDCLSDVVVMLVSEWAAKALRPVFDRKNMLPCISVFPCRTPRYGQLIDKVSNWVGLYSSVCKPCQWSLKGLWDPSIPVSQGVKFD